MAEKKKNGAKSTTPPAKNAPDKKKILVVVLVIAVIVALSIWIDSSIKNPPINDNMAAANRIFGEDVLAKNPEITYDTEVEMWEDETPQTIEGKEYWGVYVRIYPDTPEAKDFVYYVAQKDGKIYTMDKDTNKLVPYGV